MRKGIRFALMLLWVLSVAPLMGVDSTVPPMTANLSVVQAATGDITEFPVPTPGGIPFRIAPGPDGNVWFAEVCGNKIGRITPAGAVAEFSVPTPLPSACSSEVGGPAGIVAGPDGNIWFTEVSQNKVGRLTPSGVFTEFPIPTWDSSANFITAGPDGNLWFTELTGDYVGRITPAGVITEFPVPTRGSWPGDITAGPDGNLWFTEGAANKIARITTSGVITEFVIPTSNGRPAGITAGPDQNVWFTERFGNKIGRITPSGEITEFVVPSGGSPNGITAGTDGNLWFAELDANRIGRITPAGIITEFPISTRSNRITVGPDGNIWFTEHLANQIGRLETAAPNTVYVLGIAPGFVPGVRVANQGNVVQWTFLGPGTQQVDDASGMGLFGSGPRIPVSFYSFTFTAAGTYPYRNPLGQKGVVRVPILVSPTEGTRFTPFTITWSSAFPWWGYVFDVQYSAPGSGGFVDWRIGVIRTSDEFFPGGASSRCGIYRFRGRLRNTFNGKASDYSQAESIRVVGGFGLGSGRRCP